MPQGLQPAYVLHTRRFSENSLIVELLTQQHGRQGVLAKGAAGGGRSQAQRLQPFVPLLVDWRGRGELPTLVTAEPAGAGRTPTGRALYCGLYVNELVLRLTQRADPHSRLFPAYVACIAELGGGAQDNTRLEPVLRRFELDLLDELGLGLQLREDQAGEAIVAGRRYHYDLENGPREPLGQETSVDGRTLLGLAAGHFDDEQARREARQLMRYVISAQLGGGDLRSRELFRH